ncbi:MAG: hypothetical protein NDP13_00790 [Crenarchaeota archaeon]|nr:hypothetical protein [Thermoproteota archaeon]MCR8453522.1 hypothetical protein [Thermoproteota archaeon]MCR8454835.1 hypothetical protein [Thermoproteota archaeon]MCR8462726.1 hypothetical protein [Thermoproteota archaeon]MCR8470346.1 hypothetical protein [Thermoproteota archaeon]
MVREISLLGAVIDDTIAREIYEYISRTISKFQTNFHEVYAKAVSYVITGKVSLLNCHTTKKALIQLLFMVGDNDRITLISFNRFQKFAPIYASAYCSCPDFVFNVKKDHGRPFCAHIIAGFLCLKSALGSILETSDLSYRCALDRHNLSAIEAVHICVDRLLSEKHHEKED